METEATADRGASRKWAGASVILGVLAFVLLCASNMHGRSWSLWRLPFVFGLFPSSLLPYAVIRLVALFAALAAVAVGAASFQRRWPAVVVALFGTLSVCLAIVLMGQSVFAFTWLGALLAAFAAVITGVIAIRSRALAVVAALFGTLAVCSSTLALGPAVFAFLWLFLWMGALFTALVAIATRTVWSPGPALAVVMALFGTLTGCLTVALIGELTFSYFNTVRDDVDLTACGKNLRHMSEVLGKYEGGFYPPLSPQPGVLMFSPKAVPSEESIGMSLTCPTMRKAKQPTTGPASPFDDQSYFYLGYAVRNDEEVEAFAQAYRRQLAAGGTFDGDLTVETAAGTKVLRRLRRDSPVDAGVQDKTPVFIERGFGHVRIENVNGRKVRVHGGRVTYTNGADEFVPQGTWPMTESTQRILAELAQ